MNRRQVKDKILEIFDFIENKEIVYNGKTYYGHPGLYFFHTKKEFQDLLDKELEKKKRFNKYDLYYITNKLIKFLLSKYDSHTSLYFTPRVFFPLLFTIIQDKVYLINESPDLENVIGGTLLSINGVPIKQILKEFEEIICYSTKEYVEMQQCSSIISYDKLRSLPSIKDNTTIFNYEIKVENKIVNLNLDINKEYRTFKANFDANYKMEILNDNIIHIVYNMCSEPEKMIKIVENLKNYTNISKYIIDLRNNGGGNSEIIKPLVEFLKDKKVVVLVNEHVFSSGRMAYVDLKNIGAYDIGTNIATSLNCFGNNPKIMKIKYYNLKVTASCNYWYYNNNLECIGYDKTNFEDYFINHKELLEPTILKPDKEIKLTINDILNNNDTQLLAAINYFNN